MRALRNNRYIGRIAGIVLVIHGLSVSAQSQTRQFIIQNNCTETVWVAGAGKPVPVFNGSPGGYELLSGATVTTSVAVPWTGGRFWGRRECAFDGSGKGSCATGDCGGLLQCTHAGAGNTSLAEFTLTGSSTGADNYDISLVDAFDFPLSVQVNDPKPARSINPACQVDLRASCPAGQQILGKSGNVVGCASLCGKYGTPNYCCAGQYASPQACNNVHWDTNYRATAVKNFCPTVYGYAFDDFSSDFGVAPAPPGYTITFCPASTVPNSDPNAAPTFRITSLERSQTVSPGGSVSYHLSVTASRQFSGTVRLAASHLPGACIWTVVGKVSCNGAASSASFDLSTVFLTPGATVPVTLTVKTNTNPRPMLSIGNIEVTGDSGAFQNVWEGSLTVADPSAPDYTLAVTTASSQSVSPGATVVYNITLTPVNGFSGLVSLAAFGLPAGTGSFGAQQLTLSGSSPQTTTYAFITAASAVKRLYYPLFTSYSASELRDFQTTLNLSSGQVSNPDFVVSATPTSATVVPGNSAQFTIHVSPQNGFTGAVSLQALNLPAGITWSFSPSSITAPATSIMTLSASASLAPATYSIPVIATAGSLGHTFDVSLAVQGPGGQFTDLDIGDPIAKGSLTLSSGIYTVAGAGADIWGTSDQFNYAFESANGNPTIIARVADQTDTDAWAKSGIMIRETSADNSAFAAVFATPGNGVAMIVRTATGAAALDLGKKPATVPVWLKIQRTLNTFTGFMSADGISWTEIATHDINMAKAADFGLAVTSKHTSVLNTSVFDHVTIQ